MTKLASLALASLSLTAVSLTAACTETSATQDNFGERADRMEGIYRVTSHTQNLDACTPDGPEVSGEDGFAFAKRGEIFGQQFLSIYSCASLDECRQRAAQDTFEGAISFAFTLTFSDTSDSNALAGIEKTTGFSDGGNTCVDPEESRVTLALDGTSLHLARETSVGADYTTSDGFCTTDAGAASAEKALCSEMETLSLSLVESLP